MLTCNRFNLKSVVLYERKFMNNIGIYAGSFDPVTNGHFWMIRNGLNLFDRLIVAVGVNPTKKSMFTVEERMEMLRDYQWFPVTELYANRFTVMSFENKYLVEFAKEVGANYILRGIRNSTDAEFERGMRNINQDLAPDIQTVFLMPPRDLAEVSSSLVKGLVGPDGWKLVVSNYVNPMVLDMLEKKYRNT